MSDEYDPRARRLNPHIDEYVGMIDEQWRDLVVESDYLTRKAALRTIRQFIDEIIAMPEWLEADLQPGAVEAVECWLPPESFEDEAAPVFLDARPFDSPEVGESEHFFYTDTGKLSFLYRGEVVDPGRLRRPLHRHGPFVHTLERRHVTPGETRNHVIHANLWEQLRPERAIERGEEVPERWLVLCDPRGIGGGAITVRVADFADPEAAAEAAEGLADALEVRFVVARQRASFCTR